jgi:hypothetical protein
MNSNVKIATMFLSPCVSPVTEMATSPALHAEEKRVKNCYQFLHASLPVQLIVSRGVKLLPVVPVMPAVDPTPLVLPADFPEAVSLLQPEAVSNIRVYLAVLSGQKEEKDLIMRESSLPLTLGKRGRWFQNDLSINSERCNQVILDPHN